MEKLKKLARTSRERLTGRKSSQSLREDAAPTENSGSTSQQLPSRSSSLVPPVPPLYRSTASASTPNLRLPASEVPPVPQGRDNKSAPSSGTSTPSRSEKGSAQTDKDIKRQLENFSFSNPVPKESGSFAGRARKAAAATYEAKGVPAFGAKVLGAFDVARKIGLDANRRITNSAGFRPVTGTSAEALRKESTGNPFLQERENRKKEIAEKTLRETIRKKQGSLPNIVAEDGNPERRRRHAAKDSIDVKKNQTSTDKGKGRQKDRSPSR
jgi:hypothetical protein